MPAHKQYAVTVLALAILLLALTACAAAIPVTSTPVTAPVEDAVAWQQIGHQRRNGGDFDGAITAYQQALALDPNNIEANAGLGAAYLATGDNESAIQPLQHATELAPGHFWAHRLLGSAYLNLQRYPLAASELTQAYVLKPDDLQILIGIALAQGRSGQRDLALRTLDQLSVRTTDAKLLGDAEALRQEFNAD